MRQGSISEAYSFPPAEQAPVGICQRAGVGSRFLRNPSRRWLFQPRSTQVLALWPSDKLPARPSAPFARLGASGENQPVASADPRAIRPESGPLFCIEFLLRQRLSPGSPRPWPPTETSDWHSDLNQEGKPLPSPSLEPGAGYQQLPSFRLTLSLIYPGFNELKRTWGHVWACRRVGVWASGRRQTKQECLCSDK